MITVEQIEALKELWLYGYTYREIKKMLNLSFNDISLIVKALNLPSRFKNQTEWRWCIRCRRFMHISIAKTDRWSNGYKAYYCPICGKVLRKKGFRKKRVEKYEDRGEDNIP